MSTNNKKSILMLRVYVVLMACIHLIFVYMNHLRFQRAEVWQAKGSLTEQDFESIRQFGNITKIVEYAFIVLFILIALYALLSMSLSFQTLYVRYSVLLLLGIAILNVPIHFILSVSIGNLMLPLLLPALVTVLFVVYVILRTHRNKKKAAIS
ncbi:hypothetical protein PRECH8_26500 [Insulibacter thermoxylanivorax]|uniref:Uncharacterized protein n=1 Tax=Insulibacter thermoxylanivorax TaxID=2749268 RepID=A0A916QIA4_9BACL|nr:hypothetical protein PRECH8_26500 [Insulibacter thermoxylanivorax]